MHYTTVKSMTLLNTSVISYAAGGPHCISWAADLAAEPSKHDKAITDPSER